MPRENRKRGKKHKKPQPEEERVHEKADQYQDDAEQQAGPSWIVDRGAVHGDGEEQASLDVPFGFVDPDVKAYFRTVDNKLREWQEASDETEPDVDEEADPNEERKMFLVAALAELSGKERQLATDPDCSNILERMAYSMDDFVKRVFVDRLVGSYEQLSRHRFGSHVVQTLLSVAKGTVCRETRGVFPPSPESEEDEGNLPLLTRLVLNISDELLPSVTSLLMDPFASHVLRALFVLLCPTLPASTDASGSLLRSKKSAKHRAKQGPMKSVFTDPSDGAEGADVQGKGKDKAASREYPPEFDLMARNFVKTVRENLSANEVRALAANNVACPVLVLLLEMESLQETANESGSLMDSVSAGLISACLKTPPEKSEPSDFVTTLLREPTSSHLLEKLLVLAPQSAFDVMWEQYFQGKLGKLAVHPVANFVVARAIGRSNAEQLTNALEELEGSWPKVIKSSRTGVLKASIDRSVEIKSAESTVCKVVFDAFGLDSMEKRGSLVMCILYLKTFSDYQEALELSNSASKNEEGERPGHKRTSHLEPTVQGSVLVQSLLRLPDPHNQVVIDSLASLSPEHLLALSHHPISSRIIDALLVSPSVPARARRRLILAFQGHFPALVDDRIGSRVGERLWGAADPYLKEKIARALFPHENALVGSRYGKFFMRGLNLYLLKRNPEEWKALQAEAAKKEQVLTSARPTKADKSDTPSTNASKPKPDAKKRKRADKPEDEIDALFTSALGKKQKKGNLPAQLSADDGVAESDPVPEKKSKGKGLTVDRDLDNVLGAIRSAPKELKSGGKRHK
ncbi:hypothetical protein M0805_000793 [Coniferiporia weirii]|nr:hypothetical protein M0805_000793 [Coniferiporia weirii]